MIEDGKVVSVHYTLKNDAGEQLDASGSEPLAYLHGAQNIVPGLERKLTGRKVGDKVDVVVDPGDGYGMRDPRAVQDVPRAAFPPDAPIEVGAAFVVETPTGELMQLHITAITKGPDGAELVRCDANHPLAGERLHFAVEIVEVRDATDEERVHGHVHGAGGHHH
ncbi:MAG: FKBP-type peptidyl-prolyl cis-trans isomerase [Sandaracinaceae bacterium]|nr:FKBP-type peptidyl-prolyl cis-trans isomerase [Sandaracinaceae bacterium]